MVPIRLPLQIQRRKVCKPACNCFPSCSTNETTEKKTYRCLTIDANLISQKLQYGWRVLTRITGDPRINKVSPENFRQMAGQNTTIIMQFNSLNSRTGTFATLCRKSLCFFHANYEFGNQRLKTPNFKTAKGSNLKLRWGTYGPCFVQILEGIGHVIRISEQKTEMPIGGLNSSSGKSNCSGIKAWNLEASGNVVSVPKFKS